jgi:hypothetical protein
MSKFAALVGFRWSVIYAFAIQAFAGCRAFFFTFPCARPHGKSFRVSPISPLSVALNSVLTVIESSKPCASAFNAASVEYFSPLIFCS